MKPAQSLWHHTRNPTRTICLLAMMLVSPSCTGGDNRAVEPEDGPVAPTIFDPQDTPDATSLPNTPHLDASSTAPDVSPTDPNVPVPDASASNAPETTGPADAEGPPQVDPSPPSGLRYIRVVTEESPSWVSWFEVEVLGTWTGMGGEPFNLALNRPVEASSSTDDGPAGLVVDGDPSTSWNAGDFPPATLTVDLTQGAEVSEIRLRVAQMPNGHTRHVVQVAESDGVFSTLHVFEGHTTGQDWLVWPAETDTPPQVEIPPDPPPTGLPRGLAWVRSNPMFISGLAVSSGAPTAAHVNEYFDQFHGTAAHLWNDGLPGPVAGWQAAGHPDLRWVSWVQDDGTSPSNGQVLGGLGSNPAGRIGYQIGDEPGLNGDGMEELMDLDVGVNAVRAADPDAMIIVNFTFWAEEIDEMLDYYGSAMDADVYSYDRYGLDYKEHETLALIRTAALKWNRPYWRYLRSFHYVTDGPGPHHPTDLLWSTCVGLLYGYTGHTWFLYQSNAPHDVASDLYQNQGGYEVAKTSTWSDVAQMNVYLRNIGRAITQLTSTDVRYRAGQELYTPDGLVDWAPGAGDDPYITHLEALDTSLFDIKDLAIGYFVDDADEIYVMIQNQSHKNAGWPIDNTKDVTVRVDFDFTTAPDSLDPDRVRTLSRETGLVGDLSLTGLGGSKRRLETTLPAGDIIFFKYATDVPFALGP